MDTQTKPTNTSAPSETPSCQKCRQPLQRKSFRTGSTDHPPEPSLVCPHCGTRQAAG